MDSKVNKEAARKLRKLSKDLKTLMSLIVKEEVTRIQSELKDLEKINGKDHKR